jgi:hypothetical protein
MLRCFALVTLWWTYEEKVDARRGMRAGTLLSRI